MIISALSLLLLCGQGALAIEQDPRLSQPSGFWERSIALTELLSRASSMGRVRLTVDPKLAADRIDLRVKGRPLGEILAHVAECLDLDWQSAGAGYRLFRRPYVEQLQQGFIAEYKRKSAQGLLDYVRSCAHTQPPGAQGQFGTILELERKRLLSSRGRSQVTTSGFQGLDEDEASREFVAERGLAVPLVRAMSTADVRDLLSGKWAIGSTQRRPGSIFLPPETYLRPDFHYGRRPALTIGLRFDWLTWQVVGWYAFTGDPSWMRGIEIGLQPEAEPGRSQRVEYALANRLTEWANADRRAANPAAGDLEELPFVGTALPRRPEDPNGMPSGALETSVRDGFSRGPGYWRVSGGWLMHREPLYWRQSELSRLAAARLPADVRDLTSPVRTLDAVARLVDSVPEDVAASVGWDQRLGVAGLVAMNREAGQRACLRFWTRLNLSQKNRLLTVGLRRRDLTAEQRELEDVLVRFHYQTGAGEERWRPGGRLLPLKWTNEPFLVRFEVRASVQLVCSSVPGSYWTCPFNCLADGAYAYDSINEWHATDPVTEAHVQWQFYCYFTADASYYGVTSVSAELPFWRGPVHKIIGTDPDLFRRASKIWHAAEEWSAVMRRNSDADAGNLATPARARRTR